jgi:hypothetical protein
MIVFGNADPAVAAAGAVAGINFVTTAGQSCGSASRLLVHESLAAGVCKHVAAGVEGVVVGDPVRERTQMGPVITRRHLDHVQALIAAGLREGAQLLAGGGRPAGTGDRGCYVAPTVLTGVAPGSTLGQTEVFGPVLSVMTFRDEDEAVRIANWVPFGLAGAVWTIDVRRAHRVARGLEAGYIWINGSARHFWGGAFGGFKDSGAGREERTAELHSGEGSQRDPRLRQSRRPPARTAGSGQLGGQAAARLGQKRRVPFLLLLRHPGQRHGDGDRAEDAVQRVHDRHAGRGDAFLALPGVARVPPSPGSARLRQQVAAACHRLPGDGGLSNRAGPARYTRVAGS